MEKPLEKSHEEFVKGILQALLETQRRLHGGIPRGESEGISRFLLEKSHEVFLEDFRQAFSEELQDVFSGQIFKEIIWRFYSKIFGGIPGGIIGRTPHILPYFAKH